LAAIDTIITTKITEYLKKYEQYQVDVPEGKSGIWRIERFEVSEKDTEWANLRMAFQGGSRCIFAGTYTRLMMSNSFDNPIMSDTVQEIKDHWEIIKKAKGHVLINGLGLGMVAQACLNKPEVEKVTVIELSEDVIKLVAPHYKKRFGNRFEVVNISAFDYNPPKGIRYGAVWSDIWPNICADNWESYKTLKRKYCRRTDWYGAWMEWKIRDLVRGDR